MSISLAGTEEMYWAVTEFDACAGIEVTASHNPINYNGMKIVKSHSRPLDDAGDFQVIKELARSQDWASVRDLGEEFDCSTKAREAYVDRVMSFVDVKALRPLRVVVNSGNQRTVHQLGDNFGVRIGHKDNAQGAQLFLDFSVVLDNPVVDDCDVLGAVRVGVHLIGGAVRRPSRVPDTDAAHERARCLSR